MHFATRFLCFSSAAALGLRTNGKQATIGVSDHVNLKAKMGQGSETSVELDTFEGGKKLQETEPLTLESEGNENPAMASRVGSVAGKLGGVMHRGTFRSAVLGKRGVHKAAYELKKLADDPDTLKKEQTANLNRSVSYNKEGKVDFHPPFNTDDLKSM